MCDAVVAELVDALDSGSSGCIPVRVRVSPTAPKLSFMPFFSQCTQKVVFRWRARLLVLCGAFTAGIFFALIAAYFHRWVARFAYPLDLEWMEGGILLHVERILHGMPIDTPPWADFIPFAYPPLLYYATTAVSLLFGLSFQTARAVSWMALLSIPFLYFAVAIHYGTRKTIPYAAWAALGGFSLVLLEYFITGAWLDIARPDTFALALALIGGVVLTKTTSKYSAMVAAALLAAAIWTKQTALLPAIVFLPPAIIASWHPFFGLPVRHHMQSMLWLLAFALLIYHVHTRHSKAHEFQNATPTHRDVAAYAHIQELRTLPGPLLIPYHPWNARLAGFPSHFHQHALSDIRASGLQVPSDLMNSENSVGKPLFTIVVVTFFTGSGRGLKTLTFSLGNYEYRAYVPFQETRALFALCGGLINHETFH